MSYGKFVQLSSTPNTNIIGNFLQIFGRKCVRVPCFLYQYRYSALTVIGAKAVSAVLLTHLSSRRMKKDWVPSIRQGVAGPWVFHFVGETDRIYYLKGVLLTPFAHVYPGFGPMGSFPISGSWIVDSRVKIS